MCIPEVSTTNQVLKLITDYILQLPYIKPYSTITTTRILGVHFLTRGPWRLHYSELMERKAFYGNNKTPRIISDIAYSYLATVHNS